MSDLLRSLRGSARLILLVAAGSTLAGIVDPEVNGTLILMGVLLSSFAAILLLQKPR